MTVEILALGVACNLSCQYCYQNPLRDVGNTRDSYDLDAIKRAVLSTGQPMALFGGEPLLMAKADIEDLLAWGHERSDHSLIQSNGVLIDDDHIRMFRAYNVHVGISIDGPGALNDARWDGTLARTRAATAKTEAAIARLCAENIPVGLIVTAHRVNCAPENLPVFLDWLRDLAALGVRTVRLHMLEVETEEVGAKYQLSTEECLSLLQALDDLGRELPPDFIDVFHDMARALRGEDENIGCVWRGCDPYTTAAVRGIQGNGQITNCGCTNKSGVNFVKADRPGYERYLALYQTPQAHHGCAGCRFFLMCKGKCPGTAVDGDWRNRTAECALWMARYELLETRALAAGATPLSQHHRRLEVERMMLQAWANGVNPSLTHVLAQLGMKIEDLAVPPTSTAGAEA